MYTKQIAEYRFKNLEFKNRDHLSMMQRDPFGDKYQQCWPFRELSQSLSPKSLTTSKILQALSQKSNRIQKNKDNCLQTIK